MSHKCHATGCEKEVPPRMLMCAAHWRMVPKTIQRRVWNTYVEGQEIRKDPTSAYLNAMAQAIRFVEVKEDR